MLTVVFAMLISGACWGAAYNIIGHKVIRVATGWGGEGFCIDTQGSLPAGANCGNGNGFLIERGQLRRPCPSIMGADA